MSKTAFVFAGGGSLGAVQVGMLKALARQQIVPDLVVGASVGAINGAYFAGEPNEDGIARLERIWLRLRRASVFPFSPVNGILSLLGQRDYLVAPGPLRALIESELPYQRLEDARLPCHVVATDVLEGTEVELSAGDAAPALLASAAIPGIFPPVEIGGHHLMDGGVASNTPISTAIRHGATRLIILPTGTSCALEKPPHGAVAILMHALNVLIMRQLVDDTERCAGRTELIVIPPLCPVTVTPYDFSQTADLIRRAEASTRLWLKKSGLEAAGLPPALQPHDHDEAPPPSGRRRTSR
jgi:NTE family protein